MEVNSISYPQKVWIIDGKDFETVDDLHQWIKVKCGWPYYGCNVDALWDFGSTDDCFLGLLLIWKNSDISRETMKEDFIDIINVFDRIKEDFIYYGYSNRFEYLLW